jgi:N-acetylneuraminic acid mutarotase
MFAGVLEGRLIAGGGSQFRDKPNWLKGEKIFSDRIFTLAKPEGPWLEDSVRLPAKAGHFASATSTDAIYFVGGVDANACLRETWELRVVGKKLSLRRLADLPHPLGYGAVALVGHRLYVATGVHVPSSKTPSVETWSLDVSTKHSQPSANAPAAAAWRREPDLPAPGVFVAAGASDGKHFYVFGGIGFDADGKATPSARAYRLDLAAGKWLRLLDLPEPRVGPASPCPLLADGKLFVIGGYAEVFPGAQRDHPGFSRQTLFYNISRNTWENGPVLPHAAVLAADRDRSSDPGPAPMIAAPCVLWENRAVVISGEVRASVRTPAVLAWPLDARTP